MLSASLYSSAVSWPNFLSPFSLQLRMKRSMYEVTLRRRVRLLKFSAGVTFWIDGSSSADDMATSYSLTVVPLRCFNSRSASWETGGIGDVGHISFS